MAERRSHFTARIAGAMLLVAASAGISVFSQSVRRTTRTRPLVPAAPTPTPKSTTDPAVISRADDFPVDDPNRLRMGIPAASKTPEPQSDLTRATIEDLQRRLRRMENANKKDDEAKQRRLALNLDILTKAEGRSDNLRKQLFEMIEKENSTKMRLDQIEVEIRPEALSRDLATVGSLRPEELRAQRKHSLESEKTNLQALLTEVQKNRQSIEGALLKSDQLVEKLRKRLEKEIDAALSETSEDQ